MFCKQRKSAYRALLFWFVVLISLLPKVKRSLELKNKRSKKLKNGTLALEVVRQYRFEVSSRGVLKRGFLVRVEN